MIAPNCPIRTPRPARGFTLLELLVTVAVAGILFSFAAPSFQRLMQESQQSSAIYALIGDLQFARSESIKRSARLAVCAKKAGSANMCNDTAVIDWTKGWLVFTDNGDDDGQFEPATETLLRVSSPIDSRFNFDSRARVSTSAITEASVNFIRFGPRGTSNWRGGGYMLLCDREADSTERAVAVNVSLSGDIRRARRDGDGNLVSAFGTAPACPTA